MAVSLYCPLIHQLAVSTRIQVDQTCPLVSILAHILTQRRLEEIIHFEIPVMDATGKKFEGVVPSHGGTHKLAILSSYLFYASVFVIEVHLQWRHTVLG